MSETSRTRDPSPSSEVEVETATSPAQRAVFDALRQSGIAIDDLPPGVLELLQGRLAGSLDAVEAAKPARPARAAIDWSTEPKPVHANGLQVLHRPTDFAIVFTDMTVFPGRGAPDGRVGEERAVVVSSVRIGADAFFDMLCTMTSNWNRYVTTMVDSRMRQPRFKLIDAGEMQLDTIAKRDGE